MKRINFVCQLKIKTNPVEQIKTISLCSDGVELFEEVLERRLGSFVGQTFKFSEQVR